MKRSFFCYSKNNCIFASPFMMRKILVILFLLLLTVVPANAKSRDTLSAGRLEFVPNMGQWTGDFDFRAALWGGALFFNSEGYVVNMLDPDALQQLHPSSPKSSCSVNKPINAAAYKVRFEGCDPNSVYNPVGDASSHYYNYYLSSDQNRWRSHVPSYATLLRPSLYPGIDFWVSQDGQYVKYEFLVAPHANPNSVKMRYEGVKSLSLNSNILIIDNYISRVVELPPFAYQVTLGGDTVQVDCKYKLSKNVVSFELGNYDAELPLIIDPQVIFSSYSGSMADNWGYTATYDSRGNLYGGGIVFGNGYPITYGAYQAYFCGPNGQTDVGISKFDSSGNSLYFSTYLGGSFVDIPHSLYVNDNDELYVFGTTSSPDFPVTSDAFDTSFNSGAAVTLSTELLFANGADIFISRFRADGTQLLSSTFVGGSGNDGINTSPGLRKNYADDNRGEIVMDVNSNVYVVTSTQSSDFPVTVNAYDTSFNGGQDVCVFKMSYDLSQLIWGTYLGGSGNDAGYSMMLAQDQSVYLCGGTNSTNFPMTPSAWQSSCSGGVDAFVAHLSTNGDDLLHATYLGFSDYDQAYLVKGDREDCPHVVGQTSATGNSWIQNAQYSVSGGGQFLTKLSPSLDSLVWSTAFGTGNGGPDISPTALLVDYCNNIYMSGWGSAALNGFGGTSGLPVTQDAFQTTTDGSDYYFICLSDDVSQLVYASFFGGAAARAREHVDGGTSRFDRKGRIYQAVCAGCGGQSSFPTTPGAYSTVNGSTNCNLGVIKMDFALPSVVADFHAPSTVCLPAVAFFENHSQTIGGSTSYTWDFGDGTTSDQLSPTHLYAHSGHYVVTLIVQDIGSCNFADTLRKNILVLADMVETLSPKTICLGDFVQIGLPPSIGVNYHWSPATSLSNATVSNPIATPTQTTLYMLEASSQTCVDTFYQQVIVDTLVATLSSDTLVCIGDSVTLALTGQVAYDAVIWSTSPIFSSILAQNVTSLTVSPSETTAYYVQARDGACTFIGEVTVIVRDFQVQPLPEMLFCFDELELDANVSCENCQYVWSIGEDVVSYEAHPHVTPTANTNYSVTVTDNNGCTATASGYIVVRTGTFPTPLYVWCDPCDIAQADETTVFATDFGEGYSYQWHPVTEDMLTPDACSTRVSPLDTTTYIISVTDSFGCVWTDSVTVNVKRLVCDDPFIFVPNAFSPNGDGQNDVLYVRSHILDEFYFAVYSRWGQKVFETRSLEEGWDGTFQGKPCQSGVYDYYFTGICVGGQSKELKGNVTLVR